MREELESIELVARAVDRITHKGRFAEFKLSNGIVLNLRPVAPLLLQAISNEFKTPPPPMWNNPEKDREEPNPNDPRYLKEIEELTLKQYDAINNCLLGVGTSVKEIPEGYFPPESDNWIASVEFTSSIAGKKVHIDTEGIQRYLCWLRFYALETSMDVIVATSLVTQLGGIKEDEIEEIAESFRGLPERGADTDSPVETSNSNGDTANRATRRAGARDRGT